MELERGIGFSYSKPKNPISSTISTDYKEWFAKFGISVSYEPMAYIRPFRLSSFFLYSYIKRGGNFWVAIDDNHVVGTIALMKVNDDWCVMKKFFVRSDYRSRKVGFALYSRLLDFANAKGFKHMVLDTPSVAKKAHLFYERAGFHRISKSDLAIEYDYLDRDSIIFQLDL